MAFGMLFSFPNWDFVNVLLHCNSKYHNIESDLLFVLSICTYKRLLSNYTIVNQTKIDKDIEEIVVCKVVWCNN